MFVLRMGAVAYLMYRARSAYFIHRARCLLDPLQLHLCRGTSVQWRSALDPLQLYLCWGTSVQWRSASVQDRMCPVDICRMGWVLVTTCTPDPKADVSNSLICYICDASGDCVYCMACCVLCAAFSAVIRLVVCPCIACAHHHRPSC